MSRHSNRKQLERAIEVETHREAYLKAGNYDDVYTRRCDLAQDEAGRRVTASLYRGGLMVDLGCGTGKGYRLIRPDSYVGVDAMPEMIRRARERHPEADWRLLSDRPVETGTASLVTWFYALGDSDHQLEWLREGARILRPGGAFVVWGACGPGYYPSRDRDGEWRRSPRELEELAVRAGLRPTGSVGFGWNERLVPHARAVLLGTPLPKWTSVWGYRD